MPAGEKSSHPVPRVCEICFNPITINATYHMVVQRIDINIHRYYHRTCYNEMREAEGQAS
jgi:hypothetical protein